MKKNSNTKTSTDLSSFPGIAYRRYMTSAGVFTYDFLNDEIYHLLDIPIDSEITISSKGYIDAVHWADRFIISQQIENSSQSLKPYTEKFRIINKNGQVFWLSGHVTPSKGDDDSIEWYGLLIDETSKKQAEQKLDIILESSADVIISTDKDGKVLEVNKAINEMFGFEPSAIIGNSIASLLTEEHKEECENYIKNYLESENQVYDYTKILEYTGIKADGRELPIELYISALRIQGELSFMILIKDIQEQKETLKNLKNTENKLSSIVSALPCAFFTLVVTSESEYNLVYVSKGCNDLFGLSSQKFYNNSDEYLPQLFTTAKFYSYIENLYKQKSLSFYDEEIKNFNKKDSWIQIRIKPEIRDDNTIVCHGVILDVTDRRAALEKLQYLAYHDAVTEIPNRAMLIRKLGEFIKDADTKSEHVAVLSIVPSNLGLFYFSAGHDIADSILREISKRIDAKIGEENFLAYTSGSLFIAVIPHIASEKDVTKIIEIILDEFQNPIIVNDQIFDININIGGAIYPEHGKDIAELIRNSGAALNRAKRDYKDYRFFSEDINESIVNANELRSKLRTAIDNGEIRPYFQPQVEISTGEIVGMEALARWENAEGIVSPGIFIPIAEEYGLIDHIAKAILEQACIQNQKWIEEGILNVPVAVNISPRQFHNPKSLLNMVDEVLEKSKLDPKMLEVEITESSTMINPLEAERVIKILQEKGITCSIDDFGTGYSSLSVLKRFPLNKLKIDRSFIIDITNDASDASIVSATIAMAKALNLKVLAEGVETQDIFKFLEKIGCTSIQGFLFSKALPADEMTEFARNWDPQKILDTIADLR